MTGGLFIGGLVGVTVPLLWMLSSIHDELKAIRKRLDAAVKEESK